MVVSSACMMVASITQTVMMPRWGTALLILLSSHASRCPMRLLFRRDRRRAEERPQAAAMAGIDRDVDAHAGGQPGSACLVLDGELHRHALHHLHPVAGGVLRRQDREFGTGRRAHARDLGLPGLVRIGINAHLGLIADLEIS